MYTPYTLDDAISDAMKNPAFRKEWEKSAPEREIMHEIARGRAKKCMTQKELSKATKINQSNLSRIESGEISPTIKTLKKIANAFGMQVQIKFVPLKEQ